VEGATHGGGGGRKSVRVRVIEESCDASESRLASRCQSSRGVGVYRVILYCMEVSPVLLASCAPFPIASWCVSLSCA